MRKRVRDPPPDIVALFSLRLPMRSFSYTEPGNTEGSSKHTLASRGWASCRGDRRVRVFVEGGNSRLPWFLSGYNTYLSVTATAAATCVGASFSLSSCSRQGETPRTGEHLWIAVARSVGGEAATRPPTNTRASRKQARTSFPAAVLGPHRESKCDRDSSVQWPETHPAIMGGKKKGGQRRETEGAENVPALSSSVTGKPTATLPRPGRKSFAVEAVQRSVRHGQVAT